MHVHATTIIPNNPADHAITESVAERKARSWGWKKYRAITGERHGKYSPGEQTIGASLSVDDAIMTYRIAYWWVLRTMEQTGSICYRGSNVTPDGKRIRRVKADGTIHRRRFPMILMVDDATTMPDAAFQTRFWDAVYYVANRDWDAMTRKDAGWIDTTRKLPGMRIPNLMNDGWTIVEDWRERRRVYYAYHASSERRTQADRMDPAKLAEVADVAEHFGIIRSDLGYAVQLLARGYSLTQAADMGMGATHGTLSRQLRKIGADTPPNPANLPRIRFQVYWGSVIDAMFPLRTIRIASPVPKIRKPREYAEPFQQPYNVDAYIREYCNNADSRNPSPNFPSLGLWSTPEYHHPGMIRVDRGDGRYSFVPPSPKRTIDGVVAHIRATMPKATEHKSKPTPKINLRYAAGFRIVPTTIPHWDTLPPNDPTARYHAMRINPPTMIPTSRIVGKLEKADTPRFFGRKGSVDPDWQNLPPMTPRKPIRRTSRKPSDAE